MWKIFKVVWFLWFLVTAFYFGLILVQDSLHIFNQEPVAYERWILIIWKAVAFLYLFTYGIKGTANEYFKL